MATKNSTAGLVVDPADQRLHDLRREVREFLAGERAERSFAPRCDSWMSSPDPAFSRRLAARGWVGMVIPQAYGGRGRSTLERFAVLEELLAAGAPVAAHWIADRQMAPSILRHGTEEQRRRYLPSIAAGECFISIGMSEPDSGSDLASVRTRAEVVDGSWVLTGTKVWTTGAHYAHAVMVLARTDPADGDRHAGLSQFLVDLPHPAIEVRPIVTIDGEHHFNEVVFDGAVVTAGSLLGERGAGWRQVMAELAYERSGPERVMSTIPLAEAWVAEARRIGADPVVRREIGRVSAAAWSLHQMSTAVAAALAEGQAPEVEAALVKDFGSQFEQETVRAVRRVTPSPDPAFAQLLDDAVLHSPVFTLRGGTNEILRSVVARGLGAR
ncbi:acyl-CoA dehydrogenase family protein [Pseudonocardia sp. GCM10023141]|uniref:acyl-CoA dehydrogenase family protein n=1 Tax=Pseudonocardia sp. GCM10023141 TaxID=3252653 RepID=UPI00360A08AA